MRATLLTVIALSTLSLLATAGPALAQERPCAPLDQAEAYLAGEFQETRVGQGIGGNGQTMVMLYASPAGTWTVLVVNPEGVACQAADGTDWQNRSDPAPETEEGS